VGNALTRRKLLPLTVLSLYLPPPKKDDISRVINLMQTAYKCPHLQAKSPQLRPIVRKSRSSSAKRLRCLRSWGPLSDFNVTSSLNRFALKTKASSSETSVNLYHTKQGKISPTTHLWKNSGGGGYSSYLFTTSALYGMSGQRHSPATLYPRGKDPPVPIVQQAEGPQNRSGHRRGNSLASAGDRISIARSSGP
jgi:hypothetical protein